MTERKTGLVLMLMLFFHAGCSGVTPAIADPPQDVLTAEELFPHGMLLTIPGAIDEENRYLPAVKISSVIIDAARRRHYKPCSGTLVHPSLVITAAHCVCLERSPMSQEQVRPQASVQEKAARRSTILTQTEALAGVERITSIIDNSAR